MPAVTQEKETNLEEIVKWRIIEVRVISFQLLAVDVDLSRHARRTFQGFAVEFLCGEEKNKVIVTRVWWEKVSER